MNMLSKQAVTDYQKLYLKEFGKEIAYQEAERQAIALLRLFHLVYQPLPKAWLLEAGRKQKEKGGEKSNGQNI